MARETAMARETEKTNANRQLYLIVNFFLHFATCNERVLNFWDVSRRKIMNRACFLCTSGYFDMIRCVLKDARSLLGGCSTSK